MPKSPATKILILGGVKSGKSRLALTLAEKFPLPRIYVATAEPFDEEMQEKIRRHREERDASWETIEAPLELVEALNIGENYNVCLVDCLTVWLGNLWYHGRDLKREKRRLLSLLSRFKTNVILVSNEVGLGVIPAQKDVRRYAEALGDLNQELAKLCHRVYLVVAGLPLLIKG